MRLRATLRARPGALAKQVTTAAVLAASAVMSATSATSAVAAEAAATPQTVLVLATAPLPGADLRRDQIAAPVQTATAAELADSGALIPADLLNRRFGSVFVNEVQGNPFQPDVSFRGYTASPLLGTAQGLSVVMDGVRLNQPFGDVVSWDLIPRSAIDTLTLMPGSNPLFGLNTLGGALVLRTKDGLHHPGSRGELSAGSPGRWQADVQSGGSQASGLSWYGSATRFQERGWRDASPSAVSQLFGKLGLPVSLPLGDAQATLTLAHADSALQGNGLQDQQLLATRRASVYTTPDETRNHHSLLQLALQADPSAALALSAQAYLRRIDSRTLNGDVDEAALQQDDHGTPCQGLLTRGRSAQRQAGLGLQASVRLRAAGVQHLLMAGAAVDASRVHYRQQVRPGTLHADRSVSEADGCAGGPGRDATEAEAPDGDVDLQARQRSRSLYAADTLTLPGGWRLSLSLRHDRLQVHSRDQRRSAPDPASLDGDHVFAQTNPALGLVWQASSVWQLYGGANHGSRAPSAIELGCANPAQPCKLPNAMAGDPPLKAVRTRTLEFGLRGEWPGGHRWRAGVFRADNRDDLLFVADDRLGYGYFRNFGRTRRQGLELGGSTKRGRLTLDLNYTLLQATYRSPETVNGAGNSSNSAGPGLDGTIPITPGRRLPLVPRQMAKAAARWTVLPGWTVDADAMALSGMIARGNDNNAHQPDGVVYLGPGRSAGYALVNLGSRWLATPALSLFAQVNNLFDRHYSSAAQLGATAFDAQGRFVAHPLPRTAAGDLPLRGSTFLAPGAPRTVTLGLRLALR